MVLTCINSALSQIYTPTYKTIPANGSVTFVFDGNTSHRFCAFISTNGANTDAQGLWIIQGYGTGGARYKLVNIISGAGSGVETSGTRITITNSSPVPMNAY